MQINMGEPYWLFDRSQVKRLEADALYVGDFAVRSSKGLWSSIPVAVFYTPKPREGYTNSYFGVYKSQARLDMPTWVICDATSVAEHTWEGLEMKGEVIFSRWRHTLGVFHSVARASMVVLTTCAWWASAASPSAFRFVSWTVSLR